MDKQDIIKQREELFRKFCTLKDLSVQLRFGKIADDSNLNNLRHHLDLLREYNHKFNNEKIDDENELCEQIQELNKQNDNKSKEIDDIERQINDIETQIREFDKQMRKELNITDDAKYIEYLYDYSDPMGR